MKKRRFARRSLALGFLVMAAGRAASGQGFERDVTVTGPRGNSVSRSFSQERHGPFVDRSVTVTGPRGNSITRNTEVFAPRGGHYGPGPRGFIGGPPVVVGGPPVIGLGLGVAPAFNLFVGGGGAAVGIGAPVVPVVPVAPIPPPPPPATYYHPPIPYPASTAAAAIVASGKAMPVAPPPPPPGVRVVDLVADSMAKLSSIHSNTRREGSITLGQYGDARAVPSLIDRLQHDHEKEVRMAAAWALAEIGDPRASVSLETARQFDKRPDVRAVAEKSLARLPREAAEPVETLSPRTATREAARRWQASTPSSSAVDSMPMRTIDRGAVERANPDDVPPPDPTPVVRAGSPR